VFATLLGALPRPTFEDGVRADDRTEGLDPALEVVIRAQEAAGLEPVTDGRLGDPNFESLAEMLLRPEGVSAALTTVLEGWQALAAATDRATKQALPGPYSLGLRAGRDGAQVDPTAREARTLRVAEALAEIVAALADAGCPLVEIEESATDRLTDAGEHDVFREGHRRLTVEGTGSRDQGAARPSIHRSLSIVGGSVPQAAIDSILAAPYESLAVDLIAGPDNWYLVRRSSRERGVIAGVQSAGKIDEAKEVMLWAAHNAASSAGRGRDRVGIGSAGSWANLTWEAAIRKLNRLGEAARLAAMPLGEELAQSLDPRAVSARRAAVGHGPPPRSRKRR
jgi:methionine synthase II (cobalamin-independent)